ncbi:hypothetical protein LED50_21320, partial [Salmonella enterica]|nr:hypothetical protein [Salmonella enterica]
AGNVLFTLNHFMSSADEQIMAMHTPGEEELSGEEQAQTLAAARQVWLMYPRPFFPAAGQAENAVAAAGGG